MTDHKNSLKRLFIRLQQICFKVNPNKCTLGAKEISFYGVIFKEEGDFPDPQKVNSLENEKPPTCQQELRSFIGLCTRLSRFIENYSTKTAHLRDLLKNNITFRWGEPEQKKPSRTNIRHSPW